MTAIRSVAVVGGGAAAALSALALRRAFARTGLVVHWIEAPADDPVAGAYAALPGLKAFHARLGIDEPTLVARADATLSLGQEYVGWGGHPSGFLHAYGATGRPIGGLPFVGFWTKARAAGLPAGFGDFSTAVAAARHGRIATGEAGATSGHGYHLDAAAYAALLREAAVAAGVMVTADREATPEAGGVRIAGVRLSTGERIEADLYIDATGAAARLLSLVDPTAPRPRPGVADRLLTASTASFDPPPLHAQAVAYPAAWNVLHPLRSRTAVRVGYRGDLIDDDTASRLPGLALRDVEARPLQPSFRPRPWVGNVVAIGDAAASPDALVDTALHEIQIALAHLVSLFPVDRAELVEARLYNAEIDAYRARIDDFRAAHDVLSARVGEAFWDAARGWPPSAELTVKLDLFAARGMVAQLNQESFGEDDWESAMIGHSLVPRSWDPQVDKVPDQEVMTEFRAILSSVRRSVEALPTHREALDRLLAGRRR